VSLSAIRPASAQVTPGSCGFSGSFGGSGAISCVEFDPGSQTERVDFSGNHSFKVIVNVVQKFYLEVMATTFSPPGSTALTSRYPDPANEQCIPYVFAASNTSLGSCALYDVRAFDGNTHEVIPADQESNYFSGKILYRIAWNFPTLGGSFDNPRELRADDSSSPFFDITDGVFPNLQSGQDPGVDGSADGFSQYIVVQEAHGNGFAGCLAPLNCSNPTNAALNIFNAGSTIPVRVLLSPPNPAADLRLTFTDPSGGVHLAQASGKSNQGNMFRATAGQFLFNWSTLGLAPGVYVLTIAPGTNSGALFAPFTVLVTLQ
jgi:hypothetical protein